MSEQMNKQMNQVRPGTLTINEEYEYGFYYQSADVN